MEVTQDLHSDTALPWVHRGRHKNRLARAAAEIVEHTVYFVVGQQQMAAQQPNKAAYRREP